MNDPIVEEVRAYRLEHTRKFGGNLEAICEELKGVQKISGHVILRLAPERPLKSLFEKSSVSQRPIEKKNGRARE